MLKKGCALILVAIALAGCKPNRPNIEMKKERGYGDEPVYIQSQRVTVERLGVFADNLAYGGERGVYLFVDTKTGKEFIGVSGVGIAETGSHLVGKMVTQDER